MNQYQQQDRTIAIIGIYQAAQQVHTLATTGKLNTVAFNASINSIFNSNPDDTLDVFGGAENIQLGLNTLLAQMNSDSKEQGRNVEVTRYIIGLMILEKKISNDPELLSKLFRVIESAKNNRSHFGDFHENIIATLARAYSENVSTVNPRIMVNGAHGHLQNPNIANKIRALLLAGIRASMLWRQVGGSRWGLLLSRKKYFNSAKDLIRNVE